MGLYAAMRESSAPLSRALRSFLPLLFAAVVVLAFFAADVRNAAPPLTGDEPHYLAFADALTHGTFDLRSAYQDPSGPRRWLAALPADQTIEHAGHLRSIRMPMLALLLAPAMALGSLSLARLTMVAIALALLDQLWRLLGDLGYRGSARAGPWIAALTALPMLGYATHLYPEIPGALGVVIILRLLVRGSRSALIAASATAGLLPWLIIRFGVIALALAIVAIFMAARPEGWRVRDIAGAFRQRWRDAALVAAPIVASLLVFATYIRILYGTFDPRSTYPAGFTQAWSPWHVYVDGIGSLFGAGEGLIPYAPAFLIGLVGAVAAARRHRAIGWFLFGVAAIHLLVVLPLGFWGVALPGRFAIVLVPLLVIGMAEVIRVAPMVRVGVFALVAMQVVIVVTYHDINTLILDRVPQHEYLAIFPTVDPEPGLASFDLAVSHDPGPVANVDGGSLRSARADGAGVMYASPQLTMRPGRYRVGLRLLASPSSTPDAVVARLTVWELPDHRSLAERVIRGRDLDGPVGVEFSAPRQPVLWPNRVVVEVATTGVADAQLRSVITRPTTLQRDRDGVIHDGVPLAAAWLAAVAVGAVALFEIDRRRRRAPEVIRRP